MKISKVGVQIVDDATLRGDTIEEPCVKVPRHPFGMWHGLDLPNCYIMLNGDIDLVQVRRGSGVQSSRREESFVDPINRIKQSFIRGSGCNGRSKNPWAESRRPYTRPLY